MDWTEEEVWWMMKKMRQRMAAMKEECERKLRRLRRELEEAQKRLKTKEGDYDEGTRRNQD